MTWERHVGLLEGRVALVTGGARRVGRSIAHGLARAGASVVLHYNRSAEGAERVCRDLRELGADAWLLHADLSDRWSVFGHGDVGGFGIGSASDFSWETALATGYRVSRRWTLVAGYRALGVDHEGSAIQLDVVQHGPQIGAIFRWGAGLPDS